VQQLNKILNENFKHIPLTVLHCILNGFNHLWIAL